jgi:hypothetical protein
MNCLVFSFIFMKCFFIFMKCLVFLHILWFLVWIQALMSCRSISGYWFILNYNERNWNVHISWCYAWIFSVLTDIELIVLCQAVNLWPIYFSFNLNSHLFNHGVQKFGKISFIRHNDTRTMFCFLSEMRISFIFLCMHTDIM